MKIHAIVDQNGRPISIVIGPANEHDSKKFIELLETLPKSLTDEQIEEIVVVFADKGYDSNTVREYLKNRNMTACIPFRKNSGSLKDRTPENVSYKKYNSVRYVVERFFGWLKNNFYRIRIQYERNEENYLD